MSALARPPRRDAAAAWLLAAGGLSALSFAAMSQAPGPAAVGALLAAAAIAVARPVLSWERVLVALVLVILFIPIRRYRIPGDLPFQLEPYRALVALMLAGWIASLLVDSRVRLRRSGFEAPIAIIVLATVASILGNPERLHEQQSTVLKSLTFLVSFFAVFYLVVSVLRTRVARETIAKALVGGGAIVAVLALVEAATGMTPFTQLNGIIPFLAPDASLEVVQARGGTVRAFGPAEHPIALGAALVLLVPLAIYVAKVAGPRWYPALVALVIGALVTVSRTGVVMLLVVALVFLVLRPRETRRLWPLLIPMLVVTHFASPGTLGSLKQAFFPAGGLIQEQSRDDLPCDAAGRLADIGPTLDEVAEKPFLGYGYGTRIVTGPETNACILDNQWLGTLLDVGVIGSLGWLWLFLAVLHRLGGAARRDASRDAWLLVAVTASVSAYAVGMATFDALGFVQVTFLLFLVLGLGAAARPPRRLRAATAPVPQRSRAGVGPPVITSRSASVRP